MGVAVGIAAIATVYLWPRNELGHPDSGGSIWSPSQRSSSSGATQYLNPKPVDPRLDFHEKRQLGKVKEISTEDLQNLLDHFARSPASLALVYLINHDRKILLELKEHDKDPTAVVMLASYTTGDEQIFWAKRLAELQPGNAYGKLLESKELLRSGRLEEALSTLAAARACPDMDGGLSGVAGILPEAAPFLPQDQMVDLVFDQLDLATTVAIDGILPMNLKQILSELPSEKAIEVARAYSESFDKGAAGNGFSIVKGEGLTSTDYLFDLGKGVVLVSLRAAKGEEAPRSINPEPLEAISARTSRQSTDFRSNRDRLTPAQVDSIVYEVFKP